MLNPKWFFCGSSSPKSASFLFLPFYCSWQMNCKKKKVLLSPPISSVGINPPSPILFISTNLPHPPVVRAIGFVGSVCCC